VHKLASFTTQAKYFNLMIAKLYDEKWKGLIHGDLRLDNIFFTPKKNCLLIDFQTVQRGSIGRDLAWFLMYEIPSEERKANDKELVKVAYEELIKGGKVTDISFDDVWESYMFGLCFAFCFAMLVQNMIVLPDGMHDMMMCTIPRVVKSIEDYDLGTWLESQIPKDE
jgi:thiamine kinase-like enzyme